MLAGVPSHVPRRQQQQRAPPQPWPEERGALRPGALTHTPEPQPNAAGLSPCWPAHCAGPQAPAPGHWLKRSSPGTAAAVEHLHSRRQNCVLLPQHPPVLERVCNIYAADMMPVPRHWLKTSGPEPAAASKHPHSRCQSCPLLPQHPPVVIKARLSHVAVDLLGPSSFACRSVQGHIPA